MKTLTKLSLLLLSLLLAACSKEGNEEEGLEPPLKPYKLSVYLPYAQFHVDDFYDFWDRGGDISDTLFIKGGTPPYHVEPVKETFTLNQAGSHIDMKTMDIFEFMVRSVPREADQLIIRYVYPKYKPEGAPEILYFDTIEYMLYDKNGGCVDFKIILRGIF